MPFSSGLHRRAIVGTEEAYSLFSDFRKLQERYHLEAEPGVSCSSIIDEVGGVTDPPLSAKVSVLIRRTIALRRANTCENVVRP